jgi:IclR family acetate operon transcriptional repressor
MNTIVDPDALRDELRGVRLRGYALDSEETSLGLCCVGMAVDLPNLGLAGISVSGPAADYSAAARRRFAKMLSAIADRLPAALANTA